MEGLTADLGDDGAVGFGLHVLGQPFEVGHEGDPTRFPRGEQLRSQKVEQRLVAFADG